MKKQISKHLLTALALIMAVSFAFGANGSTSNVAKDGAWPFIEDFEGEEFPPEGWAIYDLDGMPPQWTKNVLLNHTQDGSFSAHHTYGTSDQAGWLVTPKIDVPVEGPHYFSFWSFNIDPSFYEKNSVLVSSGSGDPEDGDFVEVWEEASPDSEWKQYILNLEDYAGQEIYVAFLYEGDFAHEWLVDDVSFGEEFDDSPEMVINLNTIAQTLPENGSGAKILRIFNEGVSDLTYEIAIEDETAEDWLTVSPTSGSIVGFSHKDITLSFDAEGLDLGTYSTDLTITSNDVNNAEFTVAVTLNVMEAANVIYTVMEDDYTFPTDVSANGHYVSGVAWGGDASYYWSSADGITFFPGDAQGISNDGLIAGSFEGAFGGQGAVDLAGIWNKDTQTWQFLGENPETSEGTGDFYSNAYGISGDGTTVVGMQWYPDWSVKAFKWTQEDGYTMIGNPIESNSRANGISADGSVIYGWAEPQGPRTPVVWHNDEIIYIDINTMGEAFGASSNGQYVTGNVDDSGFIWSMEKGITIFEDELNDDGMLSPIAVTDDGTVFGFSAIGFPPMPDMRRAFVRHPNGLMETFNDYVFSRGWFDAEDWIFYAISAVTPDGNVLVGAAETSDGEWVSFVLDFSSGTPSIQVSVTEIYQEMDFGETETQTFTIDNVGDATLAYSINVDYIDASDWLTVSPKSGSIPAEDYDEITLTFDINIVDDAEYHANLIITSNDSENASITIPVTLKVEVVNSVSDITSDMINVYPNPASEQVTINSNEAVEQITIINMLGKTVYSSIETGANAVNLNVSTMAPGMYVVRITTNSRVYNTKLQIK